MKRPLERVFYYSASASPIGGQLTHPVNAVIEHHASTCLPQAGGHVSASESKINLHNMIRCEAAYSHTVGSIQKSTGNWTTLVTSVVEGVNVFDVVTADRMVATLAIEHHSKGYYPKVSFLGSQFQNLRVGGLDIKADVHHQSLVNTARPEASKWTSEQDIERRSKEPHWQGFPDRPWPEVPTFTDWARTQSDNILTSNAPQEIKDRFAWVPDVQKREQRGYVLCSLFDKVEGAAPGTSFGHVIQVPDLGYLFLGELIVDPIGFHLAMMRVELGCVGDGNTSMSCASGHGFPYAVAFAVLLCALCTSCRAPVEASNAQPVKQVDTLDQPTPESVLDEINRLFISGDLAAAQHIADSAYNSAPAKSTWAVQFLVERAHISLYRGDDAEVIELLTPKLPPSSALELRVRRNALLALSRERLNDRHGADRALTAARVLHPQGALASEVIGVRGSIALDRDQFTQAETDFRSALELAEHADAKFQQTQMLIDLGVIANQQQHFEDALDRFDRASALAESIGAKVTLQYALINMGWVYYDTGDFLRARDTALRAYNSAVAVGENRHQVESLKIVGLSTFRLNDQSKARMYYEKALALAEQFHNSESIFSIHQALGYLLLYENPTLAASHIHEATHLAAERRNSGNMLEQQLEEGLLLIQVGSTKEAAVLLRAFIANPASTPSLKWEAESNLAKLYEMAGDESQANQWFLRAQKTFERQRRSVHTPELELPFLGNGSDLYFAYMDHHLRRHNTHAALELIDHSRAEALADSLTRSTKGARKAVSPTVDARAIAARLDATILFYCLRSGTSYLWSITPTEENFYRLPGKEVILPFIRRHNQAIFASEDLLTQKQSTGRTIYDMLVAPAMELHPGQQPRKPGSHVVLIADEELNDLNFETLIPPTGSPHYWIEDVTITNARSLRLLEASSNPQRPGQQKKSLLLIGDPVYTGTEYPELPNAATEINQVAQHFPPASDLVFRGQQAVPDAYAASKPGEFSYIHFVAHATSNETNPLDSAIVLSKAPAQPFAYRLYARDVITQPLHADLVTISACYGSGRRNYSGEGLVGLAWAFLRAGAHNVIGALWPVSDAATPQLMENLYTGLLAGNPPDTALRNAKLATMHAGAAYQKPIYWAPFQIYSGS